MRASSPCRHALLIVERSVSAPLYTALRCDASVAKTLVITSLLCPRHAGQDVLPQVPDGAWLCSPSADLLLALTNALCSAAGIMV